MDYQDDIYRMIADMAEADDRRKAGLAPRSFQEAQQYWELIVLHRIIDGITLIFVEDQSINIPDTVPIEWLDEHG